MQLSLAVSRCLVLLTSSVKECPIHFFGELALLFVEVDSFFVDVLLCEFLDFYLDGWGLGLKAL